MHWSKTRLGDRLFVVVGPPVCNMLTVSLHLVDNIHCCGLTKSIRKC